MITSIMRRTRTLAALAMLAVVSLVAGPVQAAELTELKIALLPNESPDAEIKKHATMTQHLEKHLGIPVVVQVGIDYTAVIEALRNNHVQVAYLGPFSYVLAHEAMDGNVEPLATGVRTATGKSSYNSVIIARKDSGIATEADFKNDKTISFSDPASTLSIPSFFYQMTPKISLNTRCSINISENLSINGRTRSSGQFGICSYNINP